MVDFREIGCKDGRRKEVTQDYVQQQDLVLAVLSLQLMLPQC
jgi:hypothetical protein